MGTTNTSRDNALRHELFAQVSRTTSASPAAVYALLTDLPSHAVWGGERQSANYRLVSIDAPAGEAVVGTEFSSVGADPMGAFHDRSVVTKADRPSLLEFVTEADYTTKKGAPATWTNVHRYEVAPHGDGARVTYSIRVMRISALPSQLRLFNSPLSGLLMRFATRGPKRGLANLVAMAEAGG